MKKPEFKSWRFINENGKHGIEFSNNMHEHTERIVLEWNKFKDSEILKEMPPEVLILNPHVKKLYDACNDAAHQGVDFGHGKYSSDFVSICRKALKEWEGE